MNPTFNSDNRPTGTQDSNGGEPILSIRGLRPAVTRISHRAVLLAGAFAAVSGLVILMLGFGGHSAPQRDAVSDENAVRPTGPTDSVRDLPKDYTFDVNQAAQGIGYEGLTGQPGMAPSSRPTGPTPQELAVAEAIRDLAEERRKLLEEQLKEQQAALDSPLLFGGIKTVAPPATATGPAPTTMPTLVMLGPDAHHTAMVGGFGAGGQDPGELDLGPSNGVTQNHQSDKEAFLTDAAAVEPYLNKPLLNPISAYELKAGSVIPGALLTAINTDLPGQVIGQVTENVYDTVTGKYLLIPQGSKLLGKYQSLVTNGQDRALVVWQRLIYPNGDSIVLDGMPGTDEAGQSGLQDQVDYHLDKLAEATALSTAIAYAGNLARNPNNGNSTGYGSEDVIGDTVAQQANRVGENIIERELDVQPTITIRAGWPLRVLVNKDMMLAQYQP
jgi:type IV secretory pathway VirB10-like protein